MRFIAAVFLGILPVFAFPACRRPIENTCCSPINSFEQGHELRQNQLPPAFNAPARIDVRGSWDLYLSGSYLFWLLKQENLELGISNSGGHNYRDVLGCVVEMENHYKSGFKAALGFYSDYDGWDAVLEYTWLRSDDMSRFSQEDSNASFLIPFWGTDFCPPEISHAEGRWSVSLDFLDADLGRSGYEGTKLSLRPFFGVRGARIDQEHLATYTRKDDGVSYEIRHKSESRGIGPRAGVLANWFFGYGLRAIGSAETDILFTRYDLWIQEQSPSKPHGPLHIDLEQKHSFYLRPHLDLELGFGWGMYFACYSWHVDLSATYGFQVFWSQNMFRNMNCDFKSNLSNGDLYIHGITATLRFDF